MGRRLLSYEYNAKGAVTQITYYQNFDDAQANNPNGKKEIEKFEYNDRGLLKAKTLRHAIEDVANAVIITYVYEYEIDNNDTGKDETEFLAQIKHGSKVLREYGDYSQPNVSFYLNGNPTFAVEHNRFYKSGAIEHSGDVETTYEYNSSWEVIRETTSIIDLNGQPQIREIKHHFDKAGNLKTLKYPTPAKGSLEYSYDKLNRLTNIEDKVHSASVKSFKYFGLGKVYSCSEGNGKLIQNFSYDKQDWLESIKSGDGVFNAGTFEFKRENNGIKKSVDYITNGIVKKDSYTYDEHDRLLSAAKREGGLDLMLEMFSLDKLDNFTSTTSNNQVVNYSIKESVRVDNINNDANLKFEYDTRGNTITDDKFNYSWDDFDRVKTIENKHLDLEAYANLVGYQSLAFNQTTENIATFTFDNQAIFTVDTLQIEGVVNNELIVEYKTLATDAVWLTIPSTKVIKTLVGPTVVSFGDINVGQVRVREQNGGNGYELNSNTVFQFKNYIFPSDVWFKIEYLYDAAGRRVQKIVEGTKGYWYLFDGYQMLEERTFTRGNAGTELRRQVVYGTAINEPVYIYDASANENYYLLKNDQNTVLALYKASDGAGSAPREQYEYSGYGITNILDETGIVKSIDHDANVNTPNIKQVKSDFSNPFGYQGMWRDEHTGLYHTHYRLYDPQHVRWLTPDPAGYRDGQNLYRFYAGPNGVDVLGLDLLLAFDGTNNDWESDTNIRKIFELFKGKFKHYEIGIGKDEEAEENWLDNGALGKGAQLRIDRTLKWVEKSLKENPDEKSLVITGFSRGAATARSFVNQVQPLLAKYGAEIKFIGVFDTVPSMGGKNRRGGSIFGEMLEQNLKLPDKYKDKNIAFHAMSAHENRSQFKLFRYSGAEEMWFAGVYSDIGGGYPRNEQGLSNIALRWMLEKAKEKNVPLIDYKLEQFPVNKSNVVFHDEFKGIMSVVNTLVTRFVPNEDEEKIHNIVKSIHYNQFFGSWDLSKEINFDNLTK